MQTEATPQPQTFVHDAFVSYSRKDEAFVAALEEALEGFRPPRGLNAPQRYLDVFRDKKDFSAGEYHKSLDKHLSQSRKLIVVCSPNARRSEYVNDEVSLFARLRGAEHIIPVLLAGLPNNEARPGQEGEMAFPAALTDVMAMPLAANYLGFDARRDKLARGVYQDSWFTILANVYDVSRSELEQREKRRRARTRRITYSVLSGSIVVLSLLLVFALLSRSEALAARNTAEARRKEALDARHDAEEQRNNAVESADEARRQKVAAEEARDAEEAQRKRAEEQTEIAKEQRDLARQQTILAEQRRVEAVRQKEIAEQRERVADSRRLATQALNQMGTRLDLALLLAVEATRTVSTPEARGSLVKTLQSAPGLVTFLHGHKGPVTSVAFSPDGKTIASGGADSTVRLWDAAGRPLLDGPLYTHQKVTDDEEDEVRALAFSPDGAYLASGSLGATLRFADLKSQRPIGEDIELGKTVETIAFSPDGGRAAVGALALELYDPATGKGEEQLFDLPSQSDPWPEAAAFSRDGKLFAASCKEGLFLFDAKTRKPVAEPLTGPGPFINKLAFSPDGQILAAGGRDGTVRLWDVQTRRRLPKEPPQGDGIVLNLAFTYGGQVLAWARSDGSVRTWSIEQRVGDDMPVFVGPLSSMAFSPDGMTLALGGLDGSLRIWDMRTSHHPLGESVSTGPLLDGVAFSSDGKLIATGGDQVIIWDAASRQQLRTLPDFHVLSLAFGSDGRTLYTAGVNGVRIWDLEAGKEFVVPAEAKEPYNWGLALAPGEKLLAFGGQKLTLWDVVGRKPIPRVASDQGSVYSVAVSPDGRLLATGGEDETVRLWRLPDVTPVGSPFAFGEVAWALSFSRDGSALAAGGDEGKLQLLDARTLRPLGDPLAGHTSRIRSIAFSPDGTLMATAGFNRRLLVYDLAAREPLGDPFFPGSEHEVISGVSFSPDGRLLVGSERRQTLHFFGGSPEAWKSRACRVANRNLTPEEWCRYAGNHPYQISCPGLPAPAEVKCR